MYFENYRWTRQVQLWKIVMLDVKVNRKFVKVHLVIGTIFITSDSIERDIGSSRWEMAKFSEEHAKVSLQRTPHYINGNQFTLFFPFSSSKSRLSQSLE